MFTSFSQQLKDFLSRRAVSTVVLCLAFLCRGVQLLFFFNLRSDASFQTVATTNLLTGYGVSLSHVNAADLWTVNYTPLVNWPPGFSFLSAPLLALAGGRYVPALLGLQCGAAFALILYTRKILLRCLCPLCTVNLFTLFTAFFIYPFYGICCTDAVAIALFFIAVHEALRITQSKTYNHIATAVLTVTAIVCAFFKYLFVPLGLLIPALVWAAGWKGANNTAAKAGKRSLLVVGASVLILLIAQKIAAGNATHLASEGRGIYPENLLRFYPAIPAALLQPETVTTYVSSKAALQQAVQVFWQIAHLACFALAMLYGKRLWQLLKQKHDGASFLLATGWVTLLILIALLTALSLFVQREDQGGGGWWTYAQEPRYYGVITVFAQVILFLFIGRRWMPQKRTIWIWLLVFLLLPETFRGFYLTGKRFALLGREEYSWQYEDRLQKAAAVVISKAQKQTGGGRVVIAASHYYYANRIQIVTGAVPLDSVTAINNLDRIRSSQPVMLFVMVQKDAAPAVMPFLQTKNLLPAGRFDDYAFYTLYVNEKGAKPLP